MKERKENDCIITSYAPVVIPTLNRYEHFKRCLESLERCTGAEHTDVYVGLDYPPSEKYIEGWKKIDAFLAEKEKSNGFKNLLVRRRTQNCGVCKNGSNMRLLIKEVKEKADRYISSEDDNEFSPNFLLFINRGLNEYKDRDDVMAVCGFLFPEFAKKNPEVPFLAPFLNALGTGYWTKKRFTFSHVGLKVYVDKILSSWNLSWSLFRKRSVSLNSFLSMHFRGEYYGDVVKSAEMLLEGRYSLFPNISKVRNWGYDGTGVHCNSTNNYINQEIDGSSILIDSCDANVHELPRDLDFPWYKRCAVLFRFFGFKLTGRDWLSFYWAIK